MPSTRIAARERKSSERSASNSHITRNASSTGTGRNRSTAVTPRSSRLTRLTSSSAARLRRPGACVVKKTWLPLSARCRMSRRRYRCACGARNSSGSSIAKTTPETSSAHASSPRMRATRGAGARSSACWITRCIASADGESTVTDTRSPPRRFVGKWTIGGAPVRCSSEMVRPSASVASIESARCPSVTSAVERSKLGSSRARRAKSTLDFPAPGSPMNAQIGPGRSVRRRALRKLATRISLSSGPGTARPTYLARRACGPALLVELAGADRCRHHL